MKPKRAAIYVRVSTHDQNTALQEHELQEFAEARGWESTIYRDKGESGSKESRPALDQMLQAVRKRKTDVVLVWKLDRLARSLRQLLALSEEFQSLGVDLVAFRQNLNFEGPVGKLMYAVLGSVAEFEKNLLSDRVRAGVAQARRSGKRLGRPPLRLFSIEDVGRIKLEREKGVSVRRLAIQFGTTQFMIAKLTENGSENHLILGTSTESPKPQNLTPPHE